MISLKDLARCIGIEGSFLVVRDFFGHSKGHPRASPLGPSKQLSVLGQVRLLRGPHIHLDVVRVGGNRFSAGHDLDIDFAIFRAREIYAAVGLGIGRVSHYLLPEADADGLHAIESRRQAKRLARKYRGPHDDAIDVFFVLDYNVTSGGEDKAGIAPIGLPCNKNRYHFDGIVMGVRFFGGVDVGAIVLGGVLAHELGHGLGLHHTDTVGNLMFPTLTGTALSSDQGEEMRRHCFIQPGC
jgi:Matrixin